MSDPDPNSDTDHDDDEHAVWVLPITPEEYTAMGQGDPIPFEIEGAFIERNPRFIVELDSEARDGA